MNTFESREKGKGNFKGKGKNNVAIKVEKEKLTWKNYFKEVHVEYHCWKLHPEMRPKKFKNKEKEKVAANIQYDLGSDSGDETKITTMRLKGMETITSKSSTKASMKLNILLELFQNIPR